MWRDVFLTNRDAVLEMLGRFSEDLSVLQRAVRTGDGPALEAMFTRTRAIRRSIISAGQETAAPDFGRPHEATPTPVAPAFMREHGGGDDA
jgi:cyclohexadieny/prephenate dehydrogenase